MCRAQIDDVRSRDVRSPGDSWCEPPTYCDDCKATLSADALDHGENGFGHYRRCCGCYEKRQRGAGRLP